MNEKINKALEWLRSEDTSLVARYRDLVIYSEHDETSQALHVWTVDDVASWWDSASAKAGGDANKLNEAMMEFWPKSRAEKDE